LKMTRAQIRRVAVIGAGISGVVSAAHLLDAGLEVVVFERSHAAGGVWYVALITAAMVILSLTMQVIR
jgi:cation diffusion facilitator CzcD-associated flavoprotein CzcO